MINIHISEVPTFKSKVKKIILDTNDTMISGKFFLSSIIMFVLNWYRSAFIYLTN